jgi:multisubunit Na+/H+ antiporter MnhB subunit
MSEVRSLDLSVIDDTTRPHVVEWLRDRSAFHSWFSSLVTGSFVIITVFGSKPGLATPEGVVLAIAVALLLLSLLANLVAVWSIPSWKFRVSAGALKNGTVMRRELAITAWFSVIAFVGGLTLGFIGGMPA